MNKLTKIGASALCGSLAAISAANAGELTVTGGADMTWLSQEGAATGNPLGIGSNLTFSGSGELDNGWSVALSVAHDNANAYSNTNVTVGIPGIGDLRISQGVSGSGIDRMDDMTPTVWEEADGTGISAQIRSVNGVSAGSGVEWTPSSDIMPAGLTARVAYSPDADGSGSSDKGTAGDTGIMGSGYDLTLTATDELTGVAGLTLYGGYSSIEQADNAGNITGDQDEYVLGAKYAAGSFTVGYQVSEEDTGISGTGSTYENTAYSITFQVNDNLSVGYNHVESNQSSGAADAEADSLQAAYTMGGATIRFAEVEVENSGYTAAAANDKKGHVISVALAF